MIFNINYISIDIFLNFVLFVKLFVIEGNLWSTKYRVWQHYNVTSFGDIERLVFQPSLEYG